MSGGWKNLRQSIKSGIAAFLGSLAWPKVPIAPYSARQPRAFRRSKYEPSVLSVSKTTGYPLRSCEAIRGLEDAGTGTLTNYSLRLTVREASGPRCTPASGPMAFIRIEREAQRASCRCRKRPWRSPNGACRRVFWARRAPTLLQSSGTAVSST